MTREEKKNALHCLKVMIDEEVCEECDLYGTTGTDHCEADCVRVAIKALEQQSCEGCISRQAAIIALDDRMSSLDNVDMQIAMGFAKGIIYDLPPVTPQPKTGHWIIIDDCEQFIAKCSECGRIEDSRMISKYPYCHCGARMVEPQESEE